MVRGIMNTTSLLPLLPLLASVVGCSFGAVVAFGPVPPGMDAERYATLQVLAGRDLKCPIENLTHEELGEGRHLFKGCGREMMMLMLEGADAAAYGFARGFIEPAPSNRFAREVGCALRETVEEPVDFRTRVVAGCGKRITYSNVCDRGGSCRSGPPNWAGCLHCAWAPDVMTSKP